MENKKYNAVIIGSGLGGLIAGAFLSKWGKKVLVLEQHYIPGGCATAFKRKDYIMEVGLHEIDGLNDEDYKVQILEMLDVFKHVEFLKIPDFFHLSRSDFEFTFYHDSEKMKNNLIYEFPEEKNGIEHFFRFINDDSIPLPSISIGEWLDEYIKNDKLKLILTANLGYYSDNPYTLSMNYFIRGQRGYIKGGGNFIKGGSQKLSDYLVKYIENNEGQVLLGRKVEKIIIENDKTKGIKYKDTYSKNSKCETVYSDVIVANAAIPNIISMLPEKYKIKLHNQTKNLKTSLSLFTIYMGFNINLKEFGVKHYSNFFQESNLKTLKDKKNDSQGDWNKKSFIFVDYSQIDSQLAPEGKSVFVFLIIFLNGKTYLLKNTMKKRIR